MAVGNEADVGLLDVLEYLVEDDSTSVIGVVMESLDDGDRFAGIAHRAHALAKRMVALKIGRSSAGAHAAQAHSSRLSGSARAYDALLSSCGVASVRSVESLTGACVVLSAEFDSGRTGKHVQNDLSLTCISTSGAGGALLADFAEDRRLSLVCGGSGSWNPSVSAELESITSQGKIAHPLDVGILKGNWAAADDFMAVLERHGHDGPVAAYVHNGPTGKRDMDLLQALNARRKRSTAPVVVAAPGGLDEALTNQYLDHGIPVFRDMTSCFDALQAWQATRHFMMEVPPPVSTSSRTTPPSGRLPRVLSELESAQLLRSAGIPVVDSFIVVSASAAVAALTACSGSAVMKAAPEGVAHKNDAGLVLTGLESQDDVLQAFETLQARIGDEGFAIETPIFMQPMLRARAELIVGVASEPGLGYFLLVGLGGIHAEVLDQVVVLPVNSSRARMEAATRTSTVGRLLNHLDPDGACLEEVLTILVKLRTFLSNQSGAIESLDLNPVLVTRSGCIAVDALINQR